MIELLPKEEKSLDGLSDNDHDQLYENRAFCFGTETALTHVSAVNSQADQVVTLGGMQIIMFNI